MGTGQPSSPGELTCRSTAPEDGEVVLAHLSAHVLRAVDASDAAQVALLPCS